MCGVIGEISNTRKDVASDIYNRLLCIQNRGQEAAGIYTFDLETGKFYDHKGNGLVSAVFDEGRLTERLIGNLGLGHVRYSTTSDKNAAQPFVTDWNRIMLAHNGQVSNESWLREQLAKIHQPCKTGCDAEVLLRIFDHYFDDRRGELIERIYRSVEKLMEVTAGAYSVVVGIDQGLIAFRDPHGIRPLVYGRSDEGYVFASETVALDGLKEVQSVKPGEVIFVDKDLNVHRKVIRQGKPGACVFEWVYFDSPHSDNEGIYVNQVRYNLGKALAKLFDRTERARLEEQILSLRQGSHPNLEVLVSPVPETARPAATAFARKTGYPHSDCLVKNRFVGRTFMKPYQQKREAGVSQIRPLRIVNGNIVIVIDDSMVRGTSALKLVNSIREEGALGVHLGLTFPQVRYPCPYGIDFHDPKELIAAGRTDEEIKQLVNVDSLTYVDLDGLVGSIGLPADQLCMGCLTGEYPSPLEKEVAL